MTVATLFPQWLRPRLIIVLCGVLLGLALAPALAQTIGTVALSAGDTLTVSCGTLLTGVQTDGHSETLHCAVAGPPLNNPPVSNAPAVRGGR